MSEVTKELQSKRLIEVSGELQKALDHAKVAAKHFAEGDVPRGCAHTLALEGHILTATETLEQLKKDHALKARVD